MATPKLKTTAEDAAIVSFTCEKCGATVGFHHPDAQRPALYSASKNEAGEWQCNANEFARNAGCEKCRED